MRLSLSLACAIACVLAVRAQEAPKTIEVCDLLRDPTIYNGKRIAVRGVYFVGGHGLYLHGENCEAALVTKGYRWPSLIWLSLSQQEMERRGQSFDRALKAEIEVGVARQRARRSRSADAKSEKVTLTYVGLFETRENLAREVGQLPDGTFVTNGFGPGNSAPGQLFIDSVRDIAVEFEENAKPKQP